MAESKEYTTLVNCTPKLEAQLKSDRNILHTLLIEGLVGKDVYDDVTSPRSMLSEAQKAGEVLKEIKRAVFVSPNKYGVLLQIFKQNLRAYGGIVDALNKEYNRVPTSSLNGGGGVGGSVKVYESFNESMSVDELCLWLQKKQVPPNDLTIIRGKSIGGIAFKLSPLEDFKDYGVSNVGMIVLGHLKNEIAPNIPQVSPIQKNPTPQQPHPPPTVHNIMDHTDNSTVEKASKQPFKLRNIKAALVELSPRKYVDLSEEFGLPRRRIERHEMDWPRDSDRVLTELINDWLDSDVTASWDTLRKALINMGLARIARRI